MYKLFPSSIFVLFYGFTSLLYAAPYDYWPNDIKIFVTEEQASEVIDRRIETLAPSKVHAFIVDDNDNILNRINGKFPIEKFRKMTDKERTEWAKKYAVPEVVENIIPIMQSKAGVSLMRMHEIEKLPAVMIDNYYVFYGIPLNDSILRWQLKQDERSR